jgi:membrane-associated phospholipid phosphatase
MASKTRWATVISEAAGPAPLLGVVLLEVGLAAAAIVPTLIAFFTMAVTPYAITVWLARAGRVSDRFVADRRQRVPILVGTLLVFVAGSVAIWLLNAPAQLRWLVVIVVAGLFVVTLITLIWKVSIHATIAAFFAAMQIFLFGAWGLVGSIVLAAVIWSRLTLRAHTVAQLVVGSLLGVAMVCGYGAVLAPLP